MKRFSLLFTILALIASNIFSKVTVEGSRKSHAESARKSIDTTPTIGIATINGKEVRYYVTADKRFLNIDSDRELQVCQYNVSSLKPEGFTGSFIYQDQNTRQNRTCHYKVLSTLSKKDMVPVANISNTPPMPKV